ncbi:hypothetical protein [Streptomyces sp. NPDC047985]|uniref:hypothetical protein n=1 Tax=Streptomyces sp. NPDC047985 TaxID=3155384 RepID=UPI0034149C54
MTTTPADDAARLRSAAQRALESLDDLIANTTDPGVEALGARSELATALINTSPEVARQILGEQGLKGLNTGHTCDNCDGIDPDTCLTNPDRATPDVTEVPRAAADLLAASATEYRVPVPEQGGTNLHVRRQSVVSGVGWSVAVPGWGGGRAWTQEGWQEAISALSVDRLFCWPDPATAVAEARRALAVTEEPTR